MESQNNPQVTPEQIQEYKRLKARNEWIKMNENFLKETERKRLFHVRFVLVISITNLIVSLIYLFGL